MRHFYYSCPVCGLASSGYMMPCNECTNRMYRKSSGTCSRCAIDLAGCDDPCLSCRTDPPIVDGVKAIGPWNGPLREWLSILKYGGDTRLAAWLSDRLGEILKENWEGVSIVPIPPRPARVFHNGIDPVGILANRMRDGGIPVTRLLRRKGNRSQKALSRTDRLKEGALKYELINKLPDINDGYVLLDDVSTTGSTLNVCARILKTAGVIRVYGLVVCKD